MMYALLSRHQPGALLIPYPVRTLFAVLLVCIPMFSLAQSGDEPVIPPPVQSNWAGDGLIMVRDVPVLDNEQSDYRDALLNMIDPSSPHTYVSLDADVLLAPEVTSIELNIPGRDRLVIDRHKSYRVSGNRLVWIGKSAEYYGTVRFVISRDQVRGDLINGRINLGDFRYDIFPLTGGLHLMFEPLDLAERTCEESGRQEAVMDRPDYSPGDNGVVEDAQLRSSLAECNLRVMVVFTEAVKAAAADVAGTAEGYIADHNDANNNSAVDYDVRLARVIVTDYVATGLGENHPTYGFDSQDMIRLYEPADGFMDEMHTIRDQYDGDIVSLFVTTLHAGSGEALPIGAVASDAFHTQIWSASGQVMAHETGHLFGCRHDTFNDATSTPYAYGHGYFYTGTGTNFRTVMSYSSGCSGSCPRFDNWSSPSIFIGGNATGTASTEDNARVHREQDATVIGFQFTVTNKSMFTDDVIGDEEMADLYGSSSINTSNRSVVIESGGSATYRSAGTITLTPGFRAENGSSFNAKIESSPCSAPNLTSDPPVAEETKEIINELLPVSFRAYPNPFDYRTTLAFELAEEGPVLIEVYNAKGNLVETVLNVENLIPGQHAVDLHTADWASGFYIARLITGERVETQNLVVNH